MVGYQPQTRCSVCQSAMTARAEGVCMACHQARVYADIEAGVVTSVAQRPRRDLYQAVCIICGCSWAWDLSRERAKLLVKAGLRHEPPCRGLVSLEVASDVQRRTGLAEHGPYARRMGDVA